MKICGIMNVQTYVFLASVLVGGELSASSSYRLTPKEIAPVIHLVGCWMDIRDYLNDVEK
jgi:hypothetical protein